MIILKLWVKNSLYIIVVIILLLGYFPLVSLLTSKPKYDETIYNIVVAERNSLKKELEGITNLSYDAYNYVYGKVILRELYNFTEEIIIKTSKEVEEGSIVVNDKGVVGVVSHINKKTATVSLLTNQDTALSVKINGLYGKLKFKNKLIVEDIGKEEINIGDEVYTSGLTKYPEGLLVGRVSKIGKYIEVESDALENITGVVVLEGEKA